MRAPPLPLPLYFLPCYVVTVGGIKGRAMERNGGEIMAGRCSGERAFILFISLRRYSSLLSFFLFTCMSSSFSYILLYFFFLIFTWSCYFFLCFSFHFLCSCSLRFLCLHFYFLFSVSLFTYISLHCFPSTIC